MVLGLEVQFAYSHGAKELHGKELQMRLQKLIFDVFGIKIAISEVEALINGFLSRSSKCSQTLSPNGRLGGPFRAPVQELHLQRIANRVRESRV